MMKTLLIAASLVAVALSSAKARDDGPPNCHDDMACMAKWIEHVRKRDHLCPDLPLCCSGGKFHPCAPGEP
jgi:hypothetical protein